MKVIGVPSGFSPNNDGSNDVLYVRGFGIETMLFQVYNRWGNWYSSTTDQHIGWDGTYQEYLRKWKYISIPRS